MFAPLRFAASIGARANQVLVFVSAVITVSVICVDVPMYAILRAAYPEQRKLRYPLTPDLLRVFGGCQRQS